MKTSVQIELYERIGFRRHAMLHLLVIVKKIMTGQELIKAEFNFDADGNSDWFAIFVSGLESPSTQLLDDFLIKALSPKYASL